MRHNWLALTWAIGVAGLLAYATTTAHRGLPHGLGVVALVVAGAWTLWMFRDV